MKNWQGGLWICHGNDYANSHGTYFIARFGSENIKQRILVPAIKGEKIGTICFTEDQSGSDLGGTRTLATKVDRGWRINGRKQWITNGPIAEFCTCMERLIQNWD